MRGDIHILQQLEEEHGHVTPEQVVETARAPDHVWHHRFTWDDAVAAHRHRVDQARTLIRSVRYEIRVENKVLSSIAYVHDPDAAADEQRYVSVARIATDDDRARSALLAEFGRVASMLRRARDLAAVLGLSDKIDEAVAQIEGLSFALKPIGESSETRQ